MELMDNHYNKSKNGISPKGVKVGLDSSPTINVSAAEDRWIDSESSSSGQVLTLREYCDLFKMNSAEVWQLINCGELMAHYRNGQIYIFDGGDVPLESVLDSINSVTTDIWVDQKTENPVRTDIPYQQTLELNQKMPSSLPTLTQEDMSERNIALLIDHLSLAKEENREILKLTQISMDHITKTTEALIDAKNELLKNAQSELSKVQTDLDKTLQDLRKAKQDNEDLEMLLKALSPE